MQTKSQTTSLIRTDRTYASPEQEGPTLAPQNSDAAAFVLPTVKPTWSCDCNAILKALDEPRSPSGREERAACIKTFSNAVYQGELRDGKMHGHGHLRWNSGKTYVGDFCEDRVEGYGRSVTQNGGKCLGTFRNFKVNGWARIDAEDGGVYEGNLVDGRRHGFGVLSWEGHRYEGNFEDDERHGKGRQFSNGRWTNVEYEHGLIVVQIRGDDDYLCDDDNLLRNPPKMDT